MLVIVDMENEFCHRNGKMFCAFTRPTLGPLKHLLERARDASVPVTFVQSVRDPDAPEFKYFNVSPILIENTWNVQFVDELKPRPGERIIQKRTHDCFYHTEMDSYLDSVVKHPPDYSVIVTGVVSNVCVYHAILGFHIRNFRTIVPVDCIAGDQEGQEFTIKQMLHVGYNYNVKLSESEKIKFVKQAKSVS
jgi:nicotinamidase-related amidase